MKTRYLRLVKKQRGFTLIELLAVILILGIIALIAIPTVSSVVEQSRKGAAESSASQFVTSIGELVMTTDLQGTRLSDGLYTSKQLQDKGLNIKGTMPDEGYVLIEDGEVVGCNLNYGNFNVTCDGSNFNSTKKEETPKFTLVDDVDSNGEVSLKDKVCLEKECFYIVAINGNEASMLTEYLLNVGYKSNEVKKGEMTNNYVYNKTLKLFERKPLELFDITPKKSLIRQDSNIDWYYDDNIVYANGSINFMDLDVSEEILDNTHRDYNGYWVHDDEDFSNYPKYVYDSRSTIYKHIEAYADNLSIVLGSQSISGRLISFEELVNVGCADIYSGDVSYNCTNAPRWISDGSYWTGTAAMENMVWIISGRQYGFVSPVTTSSYGVRPVITIGKNIIEIGE